MAVVCAMLRAGSFRWVKKGWHFPLGSHLLPPIMAACAFTEAIVSTAHTQSLMPAPQSLQEAGLCRWPPWTRAPPFLSDLYPQRSYCFQVPVPLTLDCFQRSEDVTWFNEAFWPSSRQGLSKRKKSVFLSWKDSGEIWGGKGFLKWVLWAQVHLCPLQVPSSDLDCHTSLQNDSQHGTWISLWVPQTWCSQNREALIGSKGTTKNFWGNDSNLYLKYKTKKTTQLHRMTSFSIHSALKTYRKVQVPHQELFFPITFATLELTNTRRHLHRNRQFWIQLCGPNDIFTLEICTYHPRWSVSIWMKAVCLGQCQLKCSHCMKDNLEIPCNYLKHL